MQKIDQKVVKCNNAAAYSTDERWIPCREGMFKSCILEYRPKVEYVFK